MTGRVTMLALSAYFFYVVGQVVVQQFSAIAGVLR
jgi:hypothetical protein